jgi:hypothetical protein
MEIYLEKVKDLLSADSKHTLRVRENAHTGPYVESLTSHAVKDFSMINQLMEDGSKVLSHLFTSQFLVVTNFLHI